MPAANKLEPRCACFFIRCQKILRIELEAIVRPLVIEVTRGAHVVHLDRGAAIFADQKTAGFVGVAFADPTLDSQPRRCRKVQGRTHCSGLSI